MSTARLEQVMQRVVVEATAILKDGDQLFKTIGRGHPLGQTIQVESRPALFVIRMQERPGGDQVEGLAIRELMIGAIIYGAETDFSAKDAELLYLEKRLEAALDGSTLNGLTAPVRWRGYDTQWINQVVPPGTSMPFFFVRYKYGRGGPFVDGGS